ncbi:MAG TPA: hypothetical protein VFU21_24980 [Kofleriaceae bacterium]|nr:hypothetical protein [Kofleriaceae bacterium]
MGRLRRLALPALLAACGEVSSAPDGGPAPPDAGAAAALSVTVGHVFGEPLPTEGLTVLVVAPDGRLIETTTDGDGTARAEGVVAGSTLLVFLRAAPSGAPEGRLTLAVVGVEPGDALVFADPSPPVDSLGTMTVDFPDRAGAASYRVENGCTAAFPTESTTSLEFTGACVDAGAVAILIRAADDGGGLLGWIGGSGRFAAGGLLEIAGAWSDPEDLAVDLVNVPAEPQSAAGRMNPIVADQEFDGTMRSPLALDGQDVQLRLSAPSAYVDSRAVAIDLTPASADLGPQTLVHRVPAAQDTLELSLVDELLPWYGAGQAALGARALRWTRSSGREPDAQLVSATWIEDGEVIENGLFVLAPPDVTEVELPALPAEHAEYAPIAPSAIDVAVIGAESSRFDSYRQARQRGFEIAGDRDILAGGEASQQRLSGSPNAEL